MSLYIHAYPHKTLNIYNPSKEYMRRVMASRLLIHFSVVCSLLILLIFLNLEIGDADIAKPGCQISCGNVSIPFPFGIGPNCFHNSWFEIECNESLNSNGSTSFKPFLSKLDNIEVMQLGLYSFDSFVTVRIPPLNACNVDPHQQLAGIDLSRSPFYFSTEYNVFVMEGCPGDGVLVNQSQAIVAGCATVCNDDSYNTAIRTNNCYGDHCCQSPLSSDGYSLLNFYQINFTRQGSSGGPNCLVATVISQSSVQDYFGGPSGLERPLGAPVRLRWHRGRELLHNSSDYAICIPDSYYGEDTSPQSYCKCKDGYYGNPYISNGCQLARECITCNGYCSGEWDMDGNISPHTLICEKKPFLKLAAILGLSVSFGIVLVVIVLYGLYRFIKRRREMKRRAKFFKRNGGLLLEQQLSSNKGIVERTRIFSNVELDKATDNFNQNRILGQGGQGTVYKGMLTDGRIVAIKKAKLLDESQLVQFINEVVILSQINHRNVVKLLGCCLETEVPLLVYEFIPNGTLAEHIHDLDEDFVISWETCLRVIVDSAAAVAYLHSSSSVPIFHRDIKSSNILLDEKHRAKVSDFGSSRTIAIDQTHMTTIVQGTMGYLDPEYFHSYQFTEKSDVYSFGVVLLEILTKKKPIYRDNNTMEQKNLVTEFSFMTQNCRLPDILDPKIVQEAKEDELISVVELARRCISWSGKLRPTMKEVAMTLEMIMKSPAQVTRWYQEQEPFPIQVEGFDEFSMTDISDAEFTSNTLLASSSKPAYSDVYPLLPDAK